MRNFILILVISIGIAGCSEKINLTLDESAKKLVVEGYFTNETKHHVVRLTKSSGYFSNEYPAPVQGANVSIHDGANAFNLHEFMPGYYQTDSIGGDTGKTYTLTILFDGKTYTGTSLLKPVPKIDSVACKKLDFPFLNIKDLYEVDLWAMEPPPAGDYYLWNVYKNHKLYSDTLKKLFFSDDSFINGNYASGVQVQQVEGAPGDTITLSMESISKSYFDFLNGALTESGRGGGPFDGPPANVQGNITNGALGFFRASAVNYKTCIIH